MLVSKKCDMTEEEKKLREERDEARQNLEAKQKALDDYRNKEESGVLDQLRKEFVGKIVRIRQYDRGMMSAVKFERQYHYKWVRVTDVKHRWRDEIEFAGEVLEIDVQPNNYDIADHIGDDDFTKLAMSIIVSEQIRVSDDEIDDKFVTEEEIRDVYKRLNEAQNELVDLFFGGKEDEV